MLVKKISPNEGVHSENSKRRVKRACFEKKVGTLEEEVIKLKMSEKILLLCWEEYHKLKM